MKRTPAFGMLSGMFASRRRVRSCEVIATLGLALAVTAPVFAAERPWYFEGDKAGCPTGPAIESDQGGKKVRRLALLVGAGAHARLPDFGGPALDVRYMYRLLADPSGYGFPRENICVLIDQQATLDRFRSSFKNAIAARARAGDTVVIYFSGYGSQVADPDGDETDGLDESLILYDSREERPGKEAREDLVDDELEGLFGELYARAEGLHVALIVDASTQWTLGALELRPGVRFLTPRGESSAPPLPTADRQVSGLVSLRPGLVVASAASGDTIALGGTPAPGDAGGLFTAAFVRAASRAADPAPTYRQLARAVVPLAGARGRQVPKWEGALDQRVFGSAPRITPVGPSIVKLGKTIELTGASLPGFDTDAIVRVRETPKTAAEARDPRRASATLRITSINGHMATGVRVDADAGVPLALGQVATLMRPSLLATQLRLRIRPEPESGGLDKKRSKLLTDYLRKHDAVSEKHLEFVTDGRLAHEIALTYDKKQLQLLGPAGDVRRSFPPDGDAEIAEALVGLIRQQILLQLEPEPGGAFADHESIAMRVSEARSRSEAAVSSPFGSCWPKSEWNDDQRVPMCRPWKLDVQLRSRTTGGADAPLSELEIGGVVLTSGGEIYPLFEDGGSASVRAHGEPRTIDPDLSASAPIDTRDYVLMVASRDHAQIPWPQLAEPSAATLDRSKLSPLAAEITALVGIEPLGQLANRTPWTWTVVPLRSITSTSAAELGAARTNKRGRSSDTECREFTIPQLDITPYLPEDSESGLYKVLTRVHELTTACLGGACGDGAKYEQKNPWTGTKCGPAPTDAGNLKKGIDCSRAIWFVFTRAGLPYIKNIPSFPGCYVATKMMSGPGTPMSDHFASCMRDPVKRIGDVLVYRNEAQDAGHVVMVIDPARRIVWGSHAFGGTPGGDTGVEYQVMALKHSLRMFDSSAHRLVACWRHKQLIKEYDAGFGRPRGAWIEEACTK